MSNVFGDRLEVLVETFLRRLVVVGCDLQRRVGTLARRTLGQTECLGGAVASRTGHDFCTTRDALDHFRDHAIVFVMRQRRRFAGGSRRNDTSRSRRQLELDLVRANARNRPLRHETA